MKKLIAITLCLSPALSLATTSNLCTELDHNRVFTDKSGQNVLTIKQRKEHYQAALRIGRDKMKV